MHASRTKFKGQIIAEFYAPRRDTGKVIIYCPGMPSVPSRSVIEFYSQKGFWAFAIRYRGSWESSGRFLARSPEQDVLDVIDELPKGFTSMWDGRRYRIHPKAIYIFGASFGGPAAILASRDKRIAKVVVTAPVIDWHAQSKTEPLPWLGRFTKDAFGEAYRYTARDWKKLSNGVFYNPIAHIDVLDGKKVFIIQAKDDDVVPWRPADKFARETGAKLMLVKHGRHNGGFFTKPQFYKKIIKFLKS